MTTSDNHDDILGTLRSIVSLMKWGGVPLLGFVAFITVSIVADHFMIQRVKEDTNYMKPKVTRLWIESHPKEAASEASYERTTE